MTPSAAGPAGPAEAAAGVPGRGTALFAAVVAAWTFLLLFAGGMVTSREAGLSVPDWPLSYGHVVNPPGWTEAPSVFWEHSHRLLGWVLGMAAIALAVVLQRTDPRPWMRRLGWIALALVVVQGVLGGFRVQFLLHYLAAIHGSLGQGLFGLLVAVALFASPGWRGGPAAVPWESERRLRRVTFAAAVALYLQVVIGAVIRHSRLGHSFLHVLPHLAWGLVCGALGIVAMVEGLRASVRAPALQAPAMALGFGVVLQLLLGLGAYAANVSGVEEAARPPYQFWTATLHQAAGAALLAAAVVLHLRARRFVAPAGAP
jgi:cytochrome c oxidase assembly protein subunit 15